MGRTYFDDDGEKFFKRFVDARVTGVECGHERNHNGADIHKVLKLNFGRRLTQYSRGVRAREAA